MAGSRSDNGGPSTRRAARPASPRTGRGSSPSASMTRCGCACAPTSRGARACRAGSTRAPSSPPPPGCWTALALVVEPWLPTSLVAPLRRRFGQGKDRALTPALRALPARSLQPPAGFPSAVTRQQAFDTLQRLLPSLLRYEDRNSMAFSIETRLPFLDYRLVEFVFSLPDEQRLEGATTKAILRRALADRIPPAVLSRQDKMGFETPTDVWLPR